VDERTRPGVDAREFPFRFGRRENRRERLWAFGEDGRVPLDLPQGSNEPPFLFNHLVNTLSELDALGVTSTAVVRLL
jgi:hypothetical protein